MSACINCLGFWKRLRNKCLRIWFCPVYQPFYAIFVMSFFSNVTSKLYYRIKLFKRHQNFQQLKSLALLPSLQIWNFWSKSLTFVFIMRIFISFEFRLTMKTLEWIGWTDKINWLAPGDYLQGSLYNYLMTKSWWCLLKWACRVCQSSRMVVLIHTKSLWGNF